MLVCCLSCSDDDDDVNESPSITTFTDSRDGQTYETVTIGSQTWFAENLNYDAGEGSACYDDESSNCFIFGRLYEGDVAQTACPSGWHLPTVEEWQELFDYLGGDDVAHVLLEPYASIQGEEIGFNILAGGRFFANYSEVGEKGYFYTSTDGVSVSLTGGASFAIKYNCRCVQD